MDMYSAAVTMHLCPIFRQVPLPAPAPASSLRIACDEALRAFPIELGPNADLTSRTILGGSISVHDSAGQCLSSLVLGPSQFPPASRITFYASAHKPPRPGQYSVAIHLIWAPQAQEQPEGAAAAQPPQEVDVPEDIANYARLATSFCRNGTPHDVCIDFPHVGLQLWGNQKRLSKQSPYLKVLLRNKEIETSTVHPPILPPPDWAWNWYAGDSDDERDIPYVHRGLPGQKRSIGYMRKMKMVRIDDSAYSTFLAVLVWMETGLIFFAPITPEPRPPITHQPLPLQSTMVDPPAVSPKWSSASRSNFSSKI